MGRSRFLGICFLISVFWHLFWLVVFQVVVMPSRSGREGFPMVSFLGPILEEITFTSQAGEKRSIFPKRHLLKEGDELALNQGERPPGRYSAKEKTAPLEEGVFFPPGKKRVIAPAVRRDDFPGLRRYLLYKPQLPSWPYGEAAGEVGMRFLVNAEGRVEMIEMKKTSSSPELDLFAKGYLKSWIFSSLPPEAISSRQWEEVKLKFRLPLRSGTAAGE